MSPYLVFTLFLFCTVRENTMLFHSFRKLKVFHMNLTLKIALRIYFSEITKIVIISIRCHKGEGSLHKISFLKENKYQLTCQQYVTRTKVKFSLKEKSQAINSVAYSKGRNLAIKRFYTFHMSISCFILRYFFCSYCECQRYDINVKTFKS